MGNDKKEININYSVSEFKMAARWSFRHWTSGFANFWQSLSYERKVQTPPLKLVAVLYFAVAKASVSVLCIILLSVPLWYLNLSWKANIHSSSLEITSLSFPYTRKQNSFQTSISYVKKKCKKGFGKSIYCTKVFWSLP